MRYAIAICCVLLMSLDIYGDGAEKANKLTSKEIQDGWILLFDGETTFGWIANGEIKSAGGKLVIGGKQRTLARFNPMFDQGIIKFAYTSKNGNSEVITGTNSASLVETNVPWTKFESTIKGKNNSAAAVIFIVPAGTTLELRNIKLKPLGMKKIFDGKSLAGWKVLPGYKSKYTVTKDGWLNVKDGRGDIQTLATYKNFVLQLECISHGKHLNSGIFFRCLPGQYQQGYEAQISNNYRKDDPREYVINKFDSKTHKKIGTYKMKSPTADYGTGAIYRRMPARKAVSKDNDWFTMTVIANGNHFATWVNGIQVVDWTDHRPLNKNARQGCCLNPGVISIQGHDPTTNLSFRNLRIAEYK